MKINFIFLINPNLEKPNLNLNKDFEILFFKFEKFS